jgi:small subunit ribosomal protein S20|tara:strand:+ start:627 stop:893 length:267 start_codon:yes stop_codon:yes gene_type:complete
MANTKTAKRQIKVTARKTKINRIRKNDYRTSLKLVEKAISDKDQKKAQDLFQIFQKKIMRNAARGIVKKKGASRKISRINRVIRELKA